MSPVVPTTHRPMEKQNELREPSKLYCLKKMIRYWHYWYIVRLPLQNGCSPAKLLMGWKLRTTLPTISQTLQPKLPNKRALQSKEDDIRSKQKANYNCQHRERNLEPLLPGETVWLPDRESTGTIVEQSSPRSYTVQTPRGQFGRNHRHIIPTPTSELPPSAETIPTNSDIPTNSNNQQTLVLEVAECLNHQID